ncbi:nuclear transport factor 2 family protein [Mycobacterium sp. E2497]|uniref:nuclear transport factor 2 family protein n=1 Tax=Mycobacterium sp. E2497 TaxID=1834135 RepID=UPI00080211F7|nr:nuclear transport factor 2 family protein [Mycobacterium sp. E2497]OBI16065.1 hypothetical protein A5713_22455 [Mycobacterium sp. E2497]
MSAPASSGNTADRWITTCELTDLVARLCRAMDRLDEAAIAACYSDPSFDDHGAFKGSGQDFAAYLCASPIPPTHHLLGQSVVDIDGDQAWGETYFVMHGLGAHPAYGRYIDYFQRSGATWKLTYRRVVPDATVPGDASTYWRATRNRDDPAYDRLRWPPQQTWEEAPGGASGISKATTERLDQSGAGGTNRRPHDASARP